MNNNIFVLCCYLKIKSERRFKMIDIEKSTEALKQELETLSNAELHELFLFYYNINHNHFYTVAMEDFDDFLMSFDKNPFRQNDDKTFRKQLIDGLMQYTTDHMSLITAAVLLKRKFTLEEIIENYYSNFNVFDNNLF